MASYYTTRRSGAVDTRESVILENEGQRIFGVLHRPLNVSSAPVVLFCHGLAGVKTGTSRAYVLLSTRLAEAGIASFRFDCRGCGDSEGAFEEISLAGMFSDCRTALDHLASAEGIDKERIGIFGRSFGGVLAAVTALHSDCIKSMALWCPMFSGKQWQDQWQLIQTGSVPQDIANEMMRVDGQQGSFDFFESFFSIDLAGDFPSLAKIPLLHIHGENDARVHISHAEDYARYRGKQPAETRFIRLPKSDHDFSDYEEKEQAFNETVNWFRDTL
ncbi:MAG: alpha/beta fold hydrolase [Chlamydiales bacterium]|nr:alpha/beta fold hydrolase [Chlamydiia bacterium]MCP5508414.1 alpha/beta fold hydrolase [Chlamydiales bacterium]